MTIVHLPDKRKYRNRPGSEDGLNFDSQREIARYRQLKLMERAGEIRALDADKKLLRFSIDVFGVHICDYEADFRYFQDGQVVIEDVKGFRTREYLMKKRLMLAVWKVTIREV